MNSDPMKLKSLCEIQLGLLYLGASYWILQTAKALSAQAHDIAPGVIPDVASAEAAREVVESILTSACYWASICFALLVLPIIAILSRLLKAKRIEFSVFLHSLFLMLGSRLNFIAIVYLVAAITDLPFLAFDSH